VLLIDDVQFLESKARTEEEFFHTFNALHEAGSQLVLTSDRLPRDLNALEDLGLQRSKLVREGLARRLHLLVDYFEFAIHWTFSFTVSAVCTGSGLKD